MQVEKGDFVTLTVNEKSTVLVKVTRVSPLRGVAADKTQASSETLKSFEFAPEDIKSNMGPKPKFGTSYGVPVEPWYATDSVDGFADVIFYRRLKDETRSRLMVFLRKFAARVHKQGLYPNKQFEITIRENKGRWLGYYKNYKKKDTIDELCARPPEFGSKEDMNYLFAHELAHALWFNNMTPKYRASWVKAYHLNLILSQANKEKLNQLRVSLLEHEHPTAHAKDLDDDDKIIMREIYRYIAHNHTIDKQDIHDLILDGDDLKDIWPSKIDLSKKKVVVSEYALTNAKEFFAESFAFNWTEQDLPKSIRKLLTKTINSIKSGSDSDDTEED